MYIYIKNGTITIIPSSLLGFDATSLAHLYSSLQNLSSSVMLDGARWCTAIFKSLQRCSIGFKSGLWLGYSRTFTDMPGKRLLYCLGCVLRFIFLLEGKPSPKSKVLNALEQVFHQGSLCTWLCSPFPCLPVPAAEKTSPQHDAATTMLHRRELVLAR